MNPARPFNNAILFLRGVLLLAAAMTLFMTLQLAADLISSGLPLSRLAESGVVEARHLNNLINRNLNQLMAVIFTSVAIAVPLTANLYSLKFLEFFIKDPVNAAVLIFVAFCNAANTWAGFGIRTDFIPVIQLHFLLALTVLCFALVFPYLYYIFRFLHPNTLLARLEREARRNLSAALQRPGPSRATLAANIEHVANVGIRSLERGDRNPAIESVYTLDRVLSHYWTVKPRIPSLWFTVDPGFFLGFSQAAVDEMTGSHSWVEMKVYSQLHQIVRAAMGREPDLTATAAKTLRKLALEGAARSEPALRELAMEYFNTLLRLALNRREARAFFAILEQYRLFADSLNWENPDLGKEIAYYFQYYGQLAFDMQQTFLAEAVAYDLAAVVGAAWEAGAPNRAALLERFLQYDRDTRRRLKGVRKAQAILASYFLLTNHQEPYQVLQGAWADQDPNYVRQVRDELLSATREKYWEISDRRLNLDYVPDAQREKLREFFASLETPSAPQS